MSASVHPPHWLARAIECVEQEPLVDTRASLRSLRRLSHREPPGAILVGIGLCTRHQLSRAMPLDVLGMLLPAERIRRATGAARIIAMVADEHALTNGFDDASVERRARDTCTVLDNLRRRCGLERMTVLRASSFHRAPAYRALLTDVTRRLGTRDHGYVRRQIADCAYLHRAHGGLWKVGWTTARASGAARDEVAFDHRVRACYGDAIGFVYCKAGRSLVDGHHKLPPYVATDPSARICIDPNEDPARKLAAALRQARDDDAINGGRRHLKHLAYTYGRHVRRLRRGPLERRLELLLDDIVGYRDAPCTEIAVDSSEPSSAA